MGIPDRAPTLALAKKLGLWFRDHARSLPWREDPSPYKVWLSEIMLQQTQMATVIPYFKRFLKRFPDVKSLANASEDEVYQFWAGLGYYSRARNLHRAAKQIAESGFPESLEGWLALPGIGRYTAGAIWSIAYDQPAPIVDGNVVRVVARVLGMRDAYDKLVPKIWVINEAWVMAQVENKDHSPNAIRPREFSQALMELGAMVCRPKDPACGVCPWEKNCEARIKKLVSQIPRKKIKPKVIKLQESKMALLTKSGELLLTRSEGWRQKLWDLPDLNQAESDLRVHTKYIVTHHRIDRTTHVMTTVKKSKTKGAQWVPISDLMAETPPIAFGAPLKKSLPRIFALWTARI